MRIELPYPPTTNHLYITRGKFRVQSPEARAYKAEVLKLCQIARMRPLEYNVGVHINVYRPRKVGDLDNTLKAIFDALKGSAWHDDKQVIEIHAFRHDDKKNPRAIVETIDLGRD